MISRAAATVLVLMFSAEVFPQKVSTRPVAAAEFSQQAAATETITSVIDGQTVRVSGVGTVSLYGIDAPVNRSGQPTRPWAKQAHDALTAMVSGKSFRIEIREPSKVIIYYPDGGTVNEELLRSGLAACTLPKSAPEYQQWREISDNAVRAQLGLFTPPTRVLQNTNRSSADDALTVPDRTLRFENGLVAKVSAHVIERNSVFWKYSWKVEIFNNGTQPLSFSAVLTFQDWQEFPLEYSTPESASLKPGESETLSGIELLKVELAAKVYQLDLKLRKR